MARALINVPRKAQRGDVIEIKTLLSHPMETGYRRDSVGNPIPRDIISRFVCIYNGTEVFQADLFPAVARIPSYRFSRSPLKAARWSSGGPTITATLKRHRPASRSNERGA
jgi:sulfur-oxidizing protein SoxZ